MRDTAALTFNSPHPEEPRSGVSKDVPVRAGGTLRDAPDGAPQDEGRYLGVRSCPHFMPVLAMPVVMKRCRKTKTKATGSNVTTVIASR